VSRDRPAVLVTGAASGIGRAIATRLVAEGAAVLSVDLSPDPDGPGVPFAADLTTRAGNSAAVERATGEFGRLDAVIANAGFQHVASIEDFPEERWDALLAVLLTSPFLLAKYSWSSLAASGRGRFIVIASIHGLVGSPFKAGYVSAKHGVLGLVKTLALEGAEAGIVAAAICPGYVRTPLVETQIAAQAKAHGIPEDQVIRDVILARQAVKELIEPDDVAEMVSFVLRDIGRSLTGSPVVMGNGWLAS
jgi:3-hydroxybutyrate dehydrogenase